MSRNRVRNTHSLHFAAVLKWVVLVAFLSIFGIGYVMLKNKVLRLASEVNDQELVLKGWRKRNDQLRCNLNQLASIGELQRRVAALGSGMVRIGELQNVPMEGPRMERTAIARGGPTP
jgi:hypothetical protein